MKKLKFFKSGFIKLTFSLQKKTYALLFDFYQKFFGIKQLVSILNKIMYLYENVYKFNLSISNNRSKGQSFLLQIVTSNFLEA